MVFFKKKLSYSYSVRSTLLALASSCSSARCATTTLPPKHTHLTPTPPSLRPRSVPTPSTSARVAKTVVSTPGRSSAAFPSPCGLATRRPHPAPRLARLPHQRSCAGTHARPWQPLPAAAYYFGSLTRTSSPPRWPRLLRRRRRPEWYQERQLVTMRPATLIRPRPRGRRERRQGWYSQLASRTLEHPVLRFPGWAHTTSGRDRTDRTLSLVSSLLSPLMNGLFGPPSGYRYWGLLVFGEGPSQRSALFSRPSYSPKPSLVHKNT